MITNEIIANNVCAERNRLRLSQEKIALKLGISRDMYANMETNRTQISAIMLYRISEVLGCKISAFYLKSNTTNYGK